MCLARGLTRSLFCIPSKEIFDSSVSSPLRARNAPVRPTVPDLPFLPYSGLRQCIIFRYSTASARRKRRAISATFFDAGIE